ncbi:MAG TPA: acyltransferase [Candidatus Angelobacter sp.]|nr:acyltransferase [Candidatus Angelobacter sp.]
MRNRRLDVLRCIAVLLVLLRHSGMNLRFARAGWAGVDLFFVLSGFLISGLLFSEYKQHGSISFRRFFIRRGFKIYPAFYVFLLVTFLVEYSPLGHTRQSGWQFLSEILYVQNYSYGVWPHTWSLAVEEHFYILLPVFFMLLIRFLPDRRDPFRAIPAAFFVTGTVCLALRIVNVLVLPSTIENALVLRKVLIPTHERMDALFFGVMLGYLHHFRPEFFIRLFSLKRNIAVLIAAAVLLLSPALIFPEESRIMLSGGLTLLYLGFGIVLVLVLHMPQVITEKFAAWITPVSRSVAFLGMYSYSIYLWHAAMLPWVLAMLRRGLHKHVDGLALYALYFVISIAVGVLMSRFIEYPVLHVRDRLFPSMVSGHAGMVCQEPKVMTAQA